MTEPIELLEERLKEKLRSGKKLNSSEKIQYEFIQKKNKEALELDLIRIEILKENSSGELPETEEGKVLLLFQHLNKFIDKSAIYEDSVAQWSKALEE